MRTFVCELGGVMAGSLALHTHMHADRECMSRSIHAHTHCICIPDIIYGAGERVGETTAPHTHTDTPQAFLQGEGCNGAIFTMLFVGLSFPLEGKWKRWEEL